MTVRLAELNKELHMARSAAENMQVSGLDRTLVVVWCMFTVSPGHQGAGLSRLAAQHTVNQAVTVTGLNISTLCRSRVI